MKVFVLLTEVVYDYETDRRVKVFSTLEKAKKEFDEFVKKEKKNAEDEDWTIELDGMDFEAYPEGTYVEDHVLACIEEQEVL